jgi:hypothetical protein
MWDINPNVMIPEKVFFMDCGFVMSPARSKNTTSYLLFSETNMKS